MERRDFLIGSMTAVGLAATRGVWAQGGSGLDRLAVSSAGFDALMKVGAGAPGAAARTLDVRDFPQMVVDRFKIHRIELQHGHLMSTDPAYLAELRDRTAKAQSQLTQLVLDFQGPTASSALSARLQAIDLSKQWIDHAVELGCPRVLFRAGSLAADVRADAVDALKIIGEYGKAKKVAVAVENADNGVPLPAAPAQGGGGGNAGRGAGAPPAPPEMPAPWRIVVDAAKAAAIAVNPNTANFPNDAERAAGLAAMYPLSSGTSRVTFPADKYNLADAIKIAKAAGYKGLFCLETSSSGDPYAATRTAIADVLKLL